jgi:hypothetical protein
VFVDGMAHRLTLVPSFVRPWVAVEIDGRPMTRLRTPSRREPWRAATLHLDGVTITVALIHAWIGMRTDVFVEGRSLSDGRTIAEVRAQGPIPVRGYERWFGDFVAERWRPSRWETAYVAAICGLLVGLPYAVVGIIGGRAPVIAIAAGLAAAAAISFVFLTLIAWSGLLGRLNVRLLARPDLGDWRRALIFLGILTIPLTVGCVIVFVVTYANAPG